MTRLLLVGWDAADWKVINPLIARGEMPNLARLIQSGVHGNHAALYPALSPMLWTSIATGKRPTKHGIHDFTTAHDVTECERFRSVDAVGGVSRGSCGGRGEPGKVSGASGV